MRSTKCSGEFPEETAFPVVKARTALLYGELSRNLR